MKILICSHSEAYDIWHITNHFFKKNKLNLPIYLGANGIDRSKFVPKSWNYINKGEDKSFSKSLSSYLDEFNDEYIILMLDDFIILDKVDIKKLQLAFKFIKQNKGVYLRLVPNPKGDIKINNYFSKIDVRAKVPYITSLQMAIWEKNFLNELLKYDFSPWEFETRGGKTKEALENFDKFYVANFPFVKYTHFVEKGKFYPWIKGLLEKENIKLISNRQFLTEEELKRLKDNKFKIFIRNLLPKKVYVYIRKILKYKEL